MKKMHSTALTAFLEGIGTGAGLVAAIGAQGTFVLKQGILQNHVFLTAFLCTLIDILLIMVGIGGVGSLLTASPALLTLSKWGGAAFLGYYGLRSFKAIFKPHSLHISASSIKPSLKATLMTILVTSFLNPHTYLDTVVLLGSIGAQFPGETRPFFGMGAMLISFLWFFGISYGARYLTPLFQHPLSWKLLDLGIGLIMWGIAIFLIVE